MNHSIVKINPTVMKMTGLSRSSIYRKAASGEFPQIVKLGARSSGFVLEEVQQWIDDRINARQDGNLSADAGA